VCVGLHTNASKSSTLSKVGVSAYVTRKPDPEGPEREKNKKVPSRLLESFLRDLLCMPFQYSFFSFPRNPQALTEVDKQADFVCVGIAVDRLGT